VSGFLAVRDVCGRPVCSHLLEDLTRWLAWRGPDGGGIWHDGPIGLVQTRFRTTEDDEAGPGPIGLAGIRIAGDVRLDDRGALIGRLAAAGCPVSSKNSDLSLILHAYQRHGQTCLNLLAGDFAFVVWDSRQCHLFAARDQMGVVPLYWSLTETVAIVANSLHGLLAHPAVDDAFDREMIADYLAVGIRIAADRTFYRSIQRLPAGHCLTVSESGIDVRRYWSMADGPTRPLRRNPGEYIEEFRVLFADALADRLRGACTATHLSGGMDAATIAVSLARLTEPGSRSLRAYTHVVSKLFPDPEKPLAEIAARHVGIPWEAIPIESVMSEEEPTPLTIGPPEPVLPPPLSFRGAIERQAATHARVLFNGYGGDPLFAANDDAPSEEPAATRAWHESRDMAFCAAREPGLVRLWLNRPPRRAGLGKQTVAADGLLNPGFAADCRIQERRLDWINQRPTASIKGMATHPIWMARMTEADPDFTGLPLKQRFPFFDLRLIRFAAGLPRRPWRSKKALLRLAMGDLLPWQVRLRPKTGAGGEVLGAYLRAYGPPAWMYDLLNTEGIDEYVDRTAAIGSIEDVGAQDKVTMRRLAVLFCFLHWVRNRPRCKV
jgi:asparagine synthase (glutamine-hydrolysing)